MSQRLYQFINRIATWPVVALLVVVLLLCTQGFSWRQGALGYDNRVLDVRRGYTPAEAQALFENLGQPGRRLYAATELTLDLVFPFTYGSLFAVFIARLFGPKRAGLLWIPVLAAATDLLENGSVAILALTYAGQPSAFAWAAAAFTVAKSLLFLAALLLVIVGGILGLRRGRPHAERV